tara:strand:+ start:47 stop:334 length:288 start_codon:yes stop_codon:yes gene_type:complete
MSEVSFEDLKENQQRVQEGESWKDETANKPLDTHNINNALHVVLKENGIEEIKRVKIKMTEKDNLIMFEDQMGRIIEMEVIIPCMVHKPCCCSCK